MKNKKNDWLVCYDISDDQLRAIVADECKSAGLERIQYSVFYGYLKKQLISDLIEKLKDLIKNEEATISFFFICENCAQKQIHLHSTTSKISKPFGSPSPSFSETTHDPKDQASSLGISPIQKEHPVNKSQCLEHALPLNNGQMPVLFPQEEHSSTSLQSQNMSQEKSHEKKQTTNLSRPSILDVQNKHRAKVLFIGREDENSNTFFFHLTSNY